MHEINNLIHNADIKVRIITKSAISVSHNDALIPLRVALTIEKQSQVNVLKCSTQLNINFEWGTKIRKPR